MAETPDTREEQKPAELDEKPVNEETESKPTDNDEQIDEKETLQNGNEEEDEDESSEEELGSLEKPVEILSRKRDRKSTERFTLDKANEVKKLPEDELDYEKGKGLKLGDIEFIKYSLDKTLSDDLKPLHRLLYHRLAKTIILKKNIRAFCGYPFEKDTIHFQRMSNQLDRFIAPGLKFICGILGLEKGGDKEKLKERLLEFLMEPKDLEKPVPTPKKKKSKDKKKSKSEKKKTKPKKSIEVEIVSSASDDSDNEEDKPKKKAESPKKRKKDTPKKKDSKEKKSKPTVVKISVPKKNKKDSTSKGSPKKKASKADVKRKAVEDSDDDEPLVKKTKTEPTDADIKKVVTEILKDADLEEVTMKTVCRQVYDKFPDFDLTGRKDFIKNTVKEIIS